MKLLFVFLVFGFSINVNAGENLRGDVIYYITNTGCNQAVVDMSPINLEFNEFAAIEIVEDAKWNLNEFRIYVANSVGFTQEPVPVAAMLL